MNRITQCLQQKRELGQKALVTYFVNGDPNPQISLDVMHALVASGADIIEVGVPFSDPMAEGPVIQKGHERALKYNVSLRDSLALVNNFRKTNSTTPVILMGYANPVERMGYPTFTQAALDSGVDGLLTVDMPPEEAGDLHDQLKQKGLESIFLLAPTSTLQRIDSVVKMAGGFIYYVSLKGVTGAGNLDVDSVAAQIDKIRGASSLPIMVGFGIKDASSAKAIGQLADGVVVGSALVSILGNAESDELALLGLKEKVASIRQALDDIAAL